MPYLASNVAVTNPVTGQVVTLTAGDDLPDWAEGLVHESRLTDQPPAMTGSALLTADPTALQSLLDAALARIGELEAELAAEREPGPGVLDDVADLSVAEVLDAIDTLPEDERAAVAAHVAEVETAGKGRKTLLEALAGYQPEPAPED